MLLSIAALIFLDVQWLATAQSSGQPHIYSLHIKSDIRFRFAHTLVTSRVANPHDTAKQTKFEMTLPNEAFISNFTMEIDGKTYQGEVKAKAKARKQYETARRKGQSAGYVGTKHRETNRFRVSISVAAHSKLTFNLTYEELLKRKLGSYEQTIYVNPGQPVSDLQVEVYIEDVRPITHLRVPPLRDDLLTDIDLTSSNKLATVERISPTSVRIFYKPSKEQQLNASEQGVSGLFTVNYDVQRRLDGGDVLVLNGYFVHFFAPEGLPSLPKDILFVLDVSASMYHGKITQMKDAMFRILDDLQEGDRFNIIRFSSGISEWQRYLMPVTKNNIRLAKMHVRRFYSSGWTNINSALKGGLEYLLEDRVNSTVRTSILLFLTDGQATAGVTQSDRILANVRALNGGDIPIFGISFGADADYNLLRRLGSQNNGLARRIYEAADATLQLKGFYDEISTTLLSNVTMKYLEDSVDSGTMTQAAFANYFNGSEVVVAGKLKSDKVAAFPVLVAGNSADGPFGIGFTADLTEGGQPELVRWLRTSGLEDTAEKLWAYLTIKDLLRKSLAATSPDEKAKLDAEALRLSLKYNFVTPLTSMVVTRPEKPSLSKSVTSTTAPTTTMPTTTSTTMVPAQTRFPHRDIPFKSASESWIYGAGRRGGADPHFVVDVKGLKNPVCFDVHGQEGDTFELLRDPVADLNVTANIVASKAQYRGRFKTYLGSILVTGPGVRVVIDPQIININGYKMSWKAEATVHAPFVSLVVGGGGKRLVMVLRNMTRFLVKRNLAGPNPNRVDYVDFFITNGKGLSRAVDGLLGQFVYKSISVKVSRAGNRKRATFSVKTAGGEVKTFPVTLNVKPDLHMERISCWMVPNEGGDLIDGTARAYIANSRAMKPLPPL